MTILDTCYEESFYGGNGFNADHSGRAVWSKKCLRPLGAWVRIPLKALMFAFSLYFYCLV
jgi:hypothetical protein